MAFGIMYDIHSHILPGIDDGALDLAVSMEMARAYVDQGVACVACTPHILPGIYHNTGPLIREAISQLTAHLRDADLPLMLVPGADNHMVMDFIPGLRTGRLLTLADTAYVLVEPPHHVAPARLEDLFFALQLEGYVPILTHPERLTWIEERYATIQHLAAHGVWMQITSGALRGAFGRRARYWSERMLAEGLVQVVASDAHNMRARRPDLADGLKVAEALVGAEEAHHLFVTRPQGILSGVAPLDLPAISRWSPDDDLQDHEDIRRTDRPDAAVGLLDRVRRFFAE